jgi:hypothetical protein
MYFVDSFIKNYFYTLVLRSTSHTLSYRIPFVRVVRDRALEALRIAAWDFKQKFSFLDYLIIFNFTWSDSGRSC